MNFKSFVVAAATLTLLQGATAGSARRWGVPAGPFCTDFTPFTYAGCFTDPGSPRALPFVSDIATGNMTPELCVSFCKGNGYRYAGVEYYGECYCGASVQGVQVPDSNCNFPCTGNASEACGGNSIISVYQDPTFPSTNPSVVTDYVSSGCYAEGTSGRSLVYRQNNLDSTKLTVEGCLSSCKSNGYPLAGVEFGSECYCGVVLGNGTAPAPSTDCNMPCNGNAAETCGGPSRLNLYVAQDLESLQPCNFNPPPSSSSSVSVPHSTSTTSTTSSTSTSATSTTSTSTTSTTSSTSTSTTASTTSTTSQTSSSTTSKTSTSSTSSSTSTTSTTSTTSSTTAPPVVTTTTKPSTTQPPTTSSQTTTSAALCTTTIPPTCEYQCGSWCSSPLPPFTGSSDCKTAVSNCYMQISACFSHATYPDSLKCFEFSSWCDQVSSYCSSACVWGKCSNSDCKSRNPPSGPQNPPTTSVYPCPVTTTLNPTTTSCTSVPVPTSSGVCSQANNPSKGYSSNSPCGGIALPCLTCNNIKSDYDSGNQFKLYNSKDSSQCSSYGRSGVGQGCKDACSAQYQSCIGTYAQSCKSNSGWGGWGGWGWKKEKRNGGWNSWGGNWGNSGDTYNSASTKCTNQYNDCLSQNSNVNPGGRCSSWNNGWY